MLKREAQGCSTGCVVSSLLKNVALTPRPSENQLETDGRGVHPTVLQQAGQASESGISAGRRQRVLALHEARCSNFGPRLASEYLRREDEATVGASCGSPVETSARSRVIFPPWGHGSVPARGAHLRCDRPHVETRNVTLLSWLTL